MCHSSDFFCNHLKTQKPFSAWSCTKTCHGQDVAHGLWFANAPYTSLGRIICSSHLVCPSCGVSAINIRTCRLHLPPPPVTAPKDVERLDVIGYLNRTTVASLFHCLCIVFRCSADWVSFLPSWELAVCREHTLLFVPGGGPPRPALHVGQSV